MLRKENDYNKIINRNLLTLHLYSPLFFYQYSQKSIKIKKKKNTHNIFVFSKLFTKNANRKYIIKKITNYIKNCNNFAILLKNFLINKNIVAYFNFKTNNKDIISFLQIFDTQQKVTPFFAIIFFKNCFITSKTKTIIKKKRIYTNILFLNLHNSPFFFNPLFMCHLKLFFVLFNVLQLHKLSVENTTL